METNNDATSTETTKKKSSTSETGHNKNAANFGAAYQILEEMDTLYNPSNDNIKLAILDPIRTELKAAIEVLIDDEPIYKNDVAAREVAIAPLGTLMTKIINHVKSLDVPDQIKENIITLAEKIRGDKSKKVAKPETTDTESISKSQMSYDNRIANFAKLIALLAATPKYVPNETHLKITTLTTLQTNLETLSEAVNASGARIITAKKNRNKLLYQDKNNVIDLMMDVKSYLLGIGDEAKPYYKAIVKLKFRDIPK